MTGGGFLTTALVSLLIAFILSEICLKMKYPRVVGQILTGIILSAPVFHIFFTGETTMTLNFMSDLGVVFLMLLTGLSLNLHKIKQAERDSIIIAISCLILPFTLGFGVTKILGFTTLQSIVVGACLSLTAEGTTMEVLYDLKAINTKLGSIIISTGILDDIFEFILLTVAMVSLSQSDITPTGLFFRILLFAGIIFLLFKSLPLFLKLVHNDRVEFSTFSLIVLFGLTIAVIATEFHLSAVTGALIAGVLLNYSNKNKDEHRRHIKQLELITFSILIPFFFINIGLNFNLQSIISNLPMVILITLIAIIGKVGGALLVKPLTDLSWRQANLVGWALNSRGLVELVIAKFAYDAGWIPAEIFSALIAMAVITTIIFPIAVDKLAKDRKIWYD